MERMANISKINAVQKNMMADFMQEHPDLAKNIIPNSQQGKITALRLWKELEIKFNSVGPPVKDAKLWRKVYADQKYQAKKKLSFNKVAKRKTGGGPYEQRFLSQAEEQIVEASGLEVAVEGLRNVNTFGVPQNIKATSFLSPSRVHSPRIWSSEDSNEMSAFGNKREDKENRDDPTDILSCSTNGPRKDSSNVQNKIRNLNISDPKLVLLKENINARIEFKKEISQKLDKLIATEEKVLKIKEEKHPMNMAEKKVELEIKTLKLELLKSSKNC